MKTILSKLFVVILLTAMVCASMPVQGAFAAPASDGGTVDTEELESEWSNKLSQLKADGLFYTQVRLYPADYENLADLARAYYFLHKFGAALKEANTIVYNHAGFDLKGKVTHDLQAAQSVRDLAENLRIMRGIRTKMDEQGFKMHFLK